MRRQSAIIYALLLLVWVAFAAWQYQSLRRQRELIEETLHQQSHSLMAALVGGMQSHRRLGRFLQYQLHGLLEELVQSADVIAVAVSANSGERVLGAGREDLLLRIESVRESETQWTDVGFQRVETFKLQSLTSVEMPEGQRGAGGAGRGFGRMGRAEEDSNEDLFSSSESLQVALLIDSTRADQMIQRSVWSHLFVTLAGGLVCGCLAFVWQAGARVIEAQSRSRLLQAESRHWQELSQAAAGLAHETRNPLGLIRGWTQRLMQEESPLPDREHHAQAVLEECDRVTNRINQFLSFARPCEPAIQSLDPRPLVNELTTILQPDMESSGLSFDVKMDQGIERIRADRELLRQALFNLIQNAAAFAPAGDTVSITLRKQANDRWVGERCQFEIADRGPGVDPEKVQSLFTPYFTTRANGTGLGLAIVRRIAIAHGWEAAYRPRAEGGAVFMLQGIYV